MKFIQIHSKPFRTIASVNTPDGKFFHIHFSHSWLLLCSWRATNRETTHYQSTYTLHTLASTKVTVTAPGKYTHRHKCPNKNMKKKHASFFASFSDTQKHELNIHADTHIQYLCAGTKQPLIYVHTMPIHKSDDN